VSPDKKIFRVNAMVLHLAGRGLSEMGDGGVSSYDQDYEIGNYIKNLWPKDEATREEVRRQEESVLTDADTTDATEHRIAQHVHDKMIQEAVAWAGSASAPKEARRLAAAIENEQRAGDERTRTRFNKIGQALLNVFKKKAA
jgi:hypothetical protein